MCRLRTLTIALQLLVWLNPINAKCQGVNVKLTITVLSARVTSNPVDNEGGIDPRWKFYLNNVPVSVIARDNIGAVTWQTINTAIVRDRPININGSFNLGLEGWEEDNACGSSMTFDNCGLFSDDDDEHCSMVNITIGNISQMKPGVFESSPFPDPNVIFMSCGIYEVFILVTYAPSQPSAPTLRVNGAPYQATNNPLCQAPTNLTLEVSTVMTNHLTDIEYQWEYNLGGETFENWIPNPNACPGFCKDLGPLEPHPDCCSELPLILEDPPPLLWRSIPGNTNAAINGGRKEIDLLSLPGVSTIGSNTNIIFRATAVVGSLMSDPGPPGHVLFVAPAAPTGTIQSATPSCTVTNTGVLYVNNVSSLFPNYRYLLKAGNVTEAGCDPAVSGSCLQPNDKSGLATGTEFQISNLTSGWYTLFLLNNAATEGFCPRRISEIFVPSVQALSLPSAAAINASCHGVANGQVTISISGGRHTSVAYQLFRDGAGQVASATSSIVNATTAFPNLVAGSYQVTANDQCTAPVSRNVVIYQPVRLMHAELDKADATCNDPGNGQMRWRITRSTGPYDVSASAEIRYILFKGNTVLNFTETTALGYSHASLPPDDNYSLLAVELGGETCSGITYTFSIKGSSPVGIQNLSVTDVSCFDEDDGVIQVQGTGRSQYLYSLTSGNVVLTNSTGVFTGLSTGAYALVVSNVNGCNDRYTHPQALLVNQPDRLDVSVAKTDLSCFDSADGMLRSQITGGSGSLTTVWETLLGSSWVQMSNTTDVTGLHAGSYRLRVRDGGDCETVSDIATILEPDELIVTNVTTTDAICFGDYGSITASAQGGTPPYQFTVAGEDYTVDFSEKGTNINTGRYTLSIMDQNGCQTTHHKEINITAPPGPLQFSTQMTEYNGVNISCYGGGNGAIVLTAAGGNGDNYSGYRYRMDSLESASPFFSGIAAGTYSFTVIDGRGCEVSQDITFTQAQERLTLDLVDKQDVACHGDLTGLIEVKGNGGHGPYTFRINESPHTINARFSDLAAGEHEIEINDATGCATRQRYTVAALHPEITIGTEVIDVTCYGGANGSIAVNVSGGSSPYHYKWNHSNDNTPIVQELLSGNYQFSVTDNKGCTKDTAVVVREPAEPLGIKVSTTPVCYNRPGGLIEAIAYGGSPPYVYSINNGLDFQPVERFIQKEGTYTILARDRNGCVAGTSATVELRNAKTEPNFLVATTPQARDTVTIVDVSVPEPDSIHWQFDRRATVVHNHHSTPDVYFPDDGEYTVKMTAYFDGCMYDLTKLLAIAPYDPRTQLEKTPGYQAVRNLSVTPNPNSGSFSVGVELTKAYRLSIEIVNVLGMRVYAKQWASAETINEHIDLANVPAGVYLLRLATDRDARDARIVINK